MRRDRMLHTALMSSRLPTSTTPGMPSEVRKRREILDFVCSLWRRGDAESVATFSLESELRWKEKVERFGASSVDAS